MKKVVNRRPLRLRVGGALALYSLLGLSGCSDVPQQERLPPPPLPFAPRVVDMPDDAELLAQMAEAIDFRRRASFDRNFDAVDPGEGLEHATYNQETLDNVTPSAADLLIVGDELFDYAFRVEDGLGNGLAGRPGVRSGVRAAPNLRRVHKSEFGGPDSYSCASCHSKGGPDGAGNNTQNAYLRGNGDNAIRADERNAPHLLGMGPVMALAKEMSELLQAQREAGVSRARERHEVVEVILQVKGVVFGKLLIDPAGAVDTAGVRGVDSDLVIRPFGWKGHQASLRRMVEESFRIHMGLLSMREQESLRAGRLHKRDYGDGPWFDADRDEVHREIDSGMLSTMVGYLSQLEVPIIRPPKDPRLLSLFGEGSLLFEEVGCGHCHRPMLLLSKPVIELRAEQEQFRESPSIFINVATDGSHPKIEQVYADASIYRVRLFSDLRRHDMGPRLTSGYRQGAIGKSVFLTRSLWGLAGTGPYLHDGRAPTVHDAILWHGGEASSSRDLYLGLDEEERQAVLVFLLSLDRKATLAVP